MTTYERYCKIRDEKGLKDSTVASGTGIGKSTFSDWKSGRSTPKNDKLQKIAIYLGVSVEKLVGWDNESKIIVSSSTSTAEELKLLATYRRLNTLGKKEALKRVNELTCIPIYQQRELTLNAAHENSPTPEEKTAADDIMINDAEWE